VGREVSTTMPRKKKEKTRESLVKQAGRLDKGDTWELERKRRKEPTY